jgi:hypothetical protein
MMKKNKGQIALVVLLIMAGALTLGMAVSKRAVVETRIDKDEELLKQAFNAAESGIDQYLGTGIVANYQSGDKLSSAQVDVVNLGGGNLIDFGETVQANKSEVFWLVGHDGNGDINWATHYAGNNVRLCMASSFSGGIKVAYFYKVGADYKVIRVVYGGGVNAAVDLESVNDADCPTGQVKVATLNTIDNPLLLVVTPIGGGVKMSLVNDGNPLNPFPTQGKLITSTGSSISGVNVTVKRQIRWNSSLINYMLEPLQSETSITNL